MNAENWLPLVALRERRAEQALTESRQATRRYEEAAQSLNAAALAFDREEAQRTDQRRALYDAMAGQALSPSEIANLRDHINASALDSQAGRDRLQQLMAQCLDTGEAAQQARGAHSECRRDVEKSDSIRRRLILEENRKTDIQIEIELEDVAIMGAARSLTMGGRNAR